jgi:hypothetical protein
MKTNYYSQIIQFHTALKSSIGIFKGTSIKAITNCLVIFYDEYPKSASTRIDPIKCIRYLEND